MPAVIPFIPLIAGAIGATGAVVGALKADQQSEFQSDVLKRNAQIERAKAFRDEEAQRREGRQALGVQNAAFSEAGGGLGGTSADVARLSARNSELDALNIRYGGVIRGAGLLAQAKWAREEGKQQSTAMLFQAGSALLSGYGGYQVQKSLMQQPKAAVVPTTSQSSGPAYTLRGYG